VADRIALLGLELSAGIGVYPHEKGVEQRLIVDVEMELQDLVRAAKSDDLAATVDYDRVAAICREVVRSRHHQLIEAVAEEIAARTLALDARIDLVTVRVEKPGAVPDARTVRVEITRRNA
jgi:dihydroneopterin aldolase